MISRNVDDFRTIFKSCRVCSASAAVEQNRRILYLQMCIVGKRNGACEATIQECKSMPMRGKGE